MGKNSDRKKIIKAASVYTGIILGAGFASGQELIQFFVRFGADGIAGLLVSGTILALCGWAVMDICSRLGLRGYNEFITLILGKRIGRIIDFSVIVFIAVLFCTMLAGVGALGGEAFGLPFTAGVVFMAALCFIIFLFGLEGIVKLNTILAPILVVGGIFFGLYIIITDYSPVFLNATNPLRRLSQSWLWAAVVYSSYNMITAVSVLANMTDIITSRKIAKYAGLLGGLCMTLLGVCFAAPLLSNYDILSNAEVPMLKLAQNHGRSIEYFYMFILFAAIFTTAAANGFSVIEWLYQRTRANKLMLKVLITLTAVVFAHIGFSVFVSKAYPIFGYLGLFEITFIIFYFFLGKKK